MKIGPQIIRIDWRGSPGNVGEKLAQIAEAADDAGFTSLWVMDHLFQIDMAQMELTPYDPMLEAYMTLGYLAPLTSNVRLGVLVTSALYRHPGYLIKTVTTLDVLSGGGRAYLGIGAEWYEREAMGLGLPFPSLGERMERLEETLQIAKLMWSGEVKPNHGKHYRLDEPLNHPLPLSKPHPPIMVGGSGEKKTLRLVAMYADACNLFAPPFSTMEEIVRKLDVLKAHCGQIGLPYEEIKRSELGVVHLGKGGTSVAELITTCRGHADLGIQHFIFSMPNTHEIKPIELIVREVIPAVAGF